MDIFEAAMTAEGVAGYETNDPTRYTEAWQTLIDTGVCWTLQGWFGRTAQTLIQRGICYAADVPEDQREERTPEALSEMLHDGL